MDRAETIKFFERHMKEDILRYGEREAIQVAIAALREQAVQPSKEGDCEQDQSKWVSVEERLPEVHRLVLCRWTRGIGASYGFARYQHDDVWYVSNEGMPEVTHWMPLPEPPKGE